MTSEVLNRTGLIAAERIEAQAWEDWWRSIPTDVARDWGIEVRRFGSAVGIKTTRMPAGPLHRFNRVIGLGLGQPATRADIDDIFRYFANAAEFRVDLSPLSRPATLPDCLAERGMRPITGMARFVRDASPSPPVSTVLQIERAGGDMVETFGQLRVSGFELPPDFAGHTAGLANRPGWTLYMAFDGPKPVGIALLFLRDGVGWLGSDAVLPTYRQRGGQSALVTMRVRDAIAEGCSLITTETAVDTSLAPVPSYRNMARAGFMVAHTQTRFLFSGE